MRCQTTHILYHLSEVFGPLTSKVWWGCKRKCQFEEQKMRFKCSITLKIWKLATQQSTRFEQRTTTTTTTVNPERKKKQKLSFYLPPHSSASLFKCIQQHQLIHVLLFFNPLKLSGNHSHFFELDFGPAFPFGFFWFLFKNSS